MKRTFFVYLSVIVLCLSTRPVGGREFLSTSNLIQRAASATAEKYPDADDVMIDDFIQVEYQPDGTSETWDDTAVKILNEKGKREYQTLTLRFNTSYGTNYFTRIQIIKPNGAIEEVDIAAQSRVMVDPEQMSANIYNPNSKILQLTVPGLEAGDLLRFISHRVRSKTVVPDSWSDYQIFEHTSPIERLTYQVIAPGELPLKNIALKDEIPGTVSFDKLTSEQGDQIVYTWNVKDVPRMFDEPNMPTRYTVVQRLLVSTLESWEDLSKWYWELSLPRLEAVTPEMEAKARELTAGSSNTLEKIEAVFNFVSQDIRYMGITTEEEAPGYEPHDVSITFENRYGVCRDKAALLAAMLRLVDVDAFPVIIMVGPKKDEEVPQPMFNHAVTAALDDNGEYVLMDATDESTKDIFPAYLQDMSYLVARPEGDTLRTSPVIPAADNLLKITTTGNLDTEGRLTARSTLVFEGVNDTVYRGYFSRIKPEERRRFFEGHLRKHMPTAELDTFEMWPAELRDTTQPLQIELSYTARNLLIEGEENRMLKLPRLGGSLGYANFLIGKTGLKERKYPLYTRMTAGIRETLELEIPEDSGNLILPDYQAVDSGQITWNIDVAQTGGLLTATNTFLMHTVEFSPEEYLVLKQNLKDIEYNLRKKLVFENPGPAASDESDVRIIEERKSIVLEDTGQWTESTRTRLEVLTYAGKKRYSEIKIPYNPAWQNVELTRATVTLPDGTVKTIRAEELNVMDAPWAASAPRYPAGRILVANLPGVEVGSELDYEIVSTVNGKPFFSTTQTFNAHEPIDLRVLTLTAPETLELNIRNTGIAETRTESSGTVSYTWTAEQQAPVRKEEQLPPWWTFNPAVFISSGDWETYGNEVLDRLLAATEDQEETRKLAKQLTYGIRDKTKEIIILRDWVAMNLRAAGPPFTQLPLTAITPADRVLRERYGNNADRMVVLYTLLKAAGFKPEFVLSGAIPLIPEASEPLLSVPSRTAFSSVLIRVEADDRIIHLDGGSQYAELGTSSYHRRPLLELDSGRIGTVDVERGKRDRTQAVLEMSVSNDGTVGFTRSATLRGTAFEAFHKKYAEITPENRRRNYLEIVAGISQSAVAASDLVTDYSAYPGKMEYAAVAERFAVADGDYLYFTVPGGLGGSLLTYRSSERTLPLAWNSHIDILHETYIVLPDGYEPAILPENFSWQAPGGAGLIEVAVEYSKRAHAIRITQIADLRPALIPAEDFPDIIEAGRRLAHPDMSTILLKRKD